MTPQTVHAFDQRIIARFAELQAAQRVPLYGDGLTIVRPKLAKNLLIQLGYQPTTGRYLYLLDLDNHTASQDADAARGSLGYALPHVAERIAWKSSRGHTGRPSLHGFFETHKQLPTGRIYDAEGNHIGELIGGHTFDPGDLAIQMLTLTQIEHLLDFWTIQGGDVNGVRWSDRATQGARLAKGYTRIRVTKAELRAFLATHCGRVGITLDALFDERALFNRSDAAGNLMQTLMLWAHKLPGLRDAPYTVKCAAVMAYWMAAESYGKVDEKDYNPEKDGYSLIAQIVNQDTLLSGKQWMCPFWAKGNYAAVAQLDEPQPEPKRPAHRPRGGQEKQIGRLRRLLERRAFEHYGTIPYYVDDLAEYLGVSRRSIQNYLQVLVDTQQIERGQDKTDPGGRAWLILLPAFWGANNSETAAETAISADLGCK